MLANLAAFLAVAALVIVTPGQDTALTIRNTLLGGRRAGVLTAAGVAAGQAVWALATGVPIVPVRLVNTGKAVSRGLPGLPRVRAVVGEPIAVEPAPTTIAAARELTDRVRAAIDALPAPD